MTNLVNGVAAAAAEQESSAIEEPTRLDRFLAFSVEATAFSRYELQGTGQAEAYLATVDAVVGPAVVEDLLDTFDAVAAAAAGDPERSTTLLRRDILGDPRLGPVARNLAKLWFVGTWYELPRAWTEAYQVHGPNETFVVSSGAYIEGLLWPAIGANPPGAKAPGFGAWSSPPRIPPPR